MKRNKKFCTSRSMRQIRFFQLLASLGAALFFFSTAFCVEGNSASGEVAQNTYFGPISPVPGNPQLVRVEVSVYDSPKPGGLEIESVTFNGASIPLKPRDVYGFRGKGSFQYPPGKYKLSWVVNRDNRAWPRSVTHEETVFLDPRDLWVQVTIEGEEASIH